MDTLDLRGLAPPEPLERVMREATERPPGDTFAVVLHHEPHPLFAFLAQLGCTWRGASVEDGYRVIITTAP